MAEYIRKYPDAPTEEEIKTGYAPSTITAGPFVKFAFWTFAGLGISYAISYGVFKALDQVQIMENARYEQMAVRQKQDFTGPRLQPSPGHDKLDFDDMDDLTRIYGDQLKAKKLWQDDPQKLTAGKPGISDQALIQSQAALKSWK
jgi:hypothetical protein